ncbi:MAG: hypothetical protein KGN02_11400 [bacterium]|nr:hypothetical protein [bacterium]
MDLSSIATGLAAASVTQGIDIGALKATQQLDSIQASVLAASIGLGRNIDAYA